MVFDLYTVAASKVESAMQMFFVSAWYGIGLLLIAIDLSRPSFSGSWKAAGWIAWVIALLAGCCSCGSFLPS